MFVLKAYRHPEHLLNIAMVEQYSGFKARNKTSIVMDFCETFSNNFYNN